MRILYNTIGYVQFFTAIEVSLLLDIKVRAGTSATVNIDNHRLKMQAIVDAK